MTRRLPFVLTEACRWPPPSWRVRRSLPRQVLDLSRRRPRHVQQVREGHRPGEGAHVALSCPAVGQRIKTKVTNREMHRRGANPQLSLPMRNDVSLSDKGSRQRGVG